MEISDQGFSISNSYGQSLIPWKDFVKWKEGQELFLLYRSDVMFTMIPKRLISTENDLQTLREQLARNNVPDARKADKRLRITSFVIYFLLVIAIAAIVYWSLQPAR
jgi:hypothetical protein